MSPLVKWIRVRFRKRTPRQRFVKWTNIRFQESAKLEATERSGSMRMQKAVSARLLQPKAQPILERADAAKNRQRILVAVRRLLDDKPFEDIKMQDVAKAAGVGQGTLYRRFANKSELSEALFAEDLDVFREHTEQHLEDGAQDTSALERLEWLVAQKIRFIDAHLQLFLASHESVGSARFDCFKKDHHLWMVERVRALLSEAQGGGETDLCDVAFATDALLAAFSPPLLAYQRQELGFSLERVIGGVTELFVTNLGTSLARAGGNQVAPLEAR